MTAINIPYTFTPDTLADANQVNADFSAVTTVVNGNLDNTNLSSTAAIALSKLGLNPGGRAFDQSTTGQATWASGLTTDVQPRIQMTTDKGLQFGPGGTTTPDVELIRSATNTLQFLAPGGGTATLDGNGGTIDNVANITLASGGDLNLNGGFISGLSLGMVNNGRLYMVSGSPYADSSAAATLYFGPTGGNQITLYNGSAEVTQTFSEVSISTGALSTGVYDVYVKSASSTTVVLSTVAWGGLTIPPTRGTQDGRPTKNGDATSLLIAAVWVDGSNHVTDNTSIRGLSNLYNTMSKSVFAQVPVASWNYGTATWRAVDANSTDGQGRLSIVRIGFNHTDLDVTYLQTLSLTGSSSNPSMAFAIAIDSTTVQTSLTGLLTAVGSTTSINGSVTVRYTNNISAGYHNVQMLENALGGATVTMNGNSTNANSGMAGFVLV